MKWNRLGIVLVGASLVLVAAGPVLAEDSMAATDIETLAIEMASTPEQHKALAAHFRERAEAMSEEANHHRLMKHGYKGAARAAGQAHCDRLVKAYEAAATEYEALAKLHEQEAGQ